MRVSRSESQDSFADEGVFFLSGAAAAEVQTELVGSVGSPCVLKEIESGALAVETTRGNAESLDEDGLWRLRLP